MFFHSCFECSVCFLNRTKRKKTFSNSFKDDENIITDKMTIANKFKNVDDSTVKSIIDKLSPKTSFGFDGISTKLVKTAQDFTSKLITPSLNESHNLFFLVSL